MNELQACYENSNLLQDNHVAVPAGLFAVVAEFPDHCPVTDAVLRNPGRRLVKLYGTRRIAEYVAAKMNAATGEDYEIGYTVLPQIPYAPRRLVNDPDMPF